MLPPAVCHQLLQALTESASTGASASLPQPTPTIELTEVGTLATVGIWATLLLINLLCLRRLLRKHPQTP